MRRTILLFIALFFFNSSVNAKDYLGAEVYSLDSLTYGKWEIRMKTCGGDGFLSTFFLYKNDSWIEGQTWREIDVEVLGRYTDLFQTNIYTGENESPVSSEELCPLPADPSQNFLTYTLEWTPDSICWYVEGVLVRRSVSDQVTDCRDDTMSYRLNAWISGSVQWAGQFDSTSLPVYQFINWVKYYSYTPGIGTDGVNFTFSWVDDFDSFNTTRWGKANWTFDGNLVDFDTANAVIDNGMLVLCVTTPQSPGFNSVVPEDPGFVISISAPLKQKYSAVPYYANALKIINIEGNNGGMSLRLFSANGRLANIHKTASGVFMTRRENKFR